MTTILRQLSHRASHGRAFALTLFVLAAVGLGTVGTVRADVITDWNIIALTQASAAGIGPPQQGRVASITHAAIFDAVNAIEPRYSAYAVNAPVTTPASPEAAAAAAAHRVLVHLFPASQTTLDQQYALTLSQIPDGDAETNGINVGEFVADEILALRSLDGSAPISYTLPPAGLGIWRPTSPAPPALPQWGGVTPFVLESATQFHAPPPPALTSEEYAVDVNEVKLFGRLNGSLRTADQTELARFWMEPGSLQWNRIARALSAERQLTLAENARLFALLNFAYTDANIVVFETKYRFNFWRPIHAIRENDGTTQYDDGNAETVPDPTFTPLLTTPNHPEYLSGHCISSGAAAEVLKQFFGQQAGFSTTSTSLPGVTRSFSNPAEASREVIDARVFGGIHFRRTCVLSNAIGNKIGKFAVNNYLRPL